MVLSKNTCPGIVSLMKQDSLKSESLIHLRIKKKKKKCQYEHALISKIVCFCLIVCNASISQVFMVFGIATSRSTTMDCDWPI